MYIKLNLIPNLLSAAQFCVHDNKVQWSAPHKVNFWTGCGFPVPVTGNEETAIGGRELKEGKGGAGEQ